MNRVQNSRSADFNGQRAPHAESGFVLPTAIFLLVILAALAAFMATLSRTSHISSSLDIQGGRAYQAARAGIEWAAWRVVQTPALSCNAVPMPPLTGALASFTVDVSCVASGPYADGATSVTVYQVTSTATSGVPGSVDYVSREIQGSFSK